MHCKLENFGYILALTVTALPFCVHALTWIRKKHVFTHFQLTWSRNDLILIILDSSIICSNSSAEWHSKLFVFTKSLLYEYRICISFFLALAFCLFWILIHICWWLSCTLTFFICYIWIFVCISFFLALTFCLFLRPSLILIKSALAS